MIYNLILLGRSRLSCVMKDNLRRYILIVWSMIDISSVQSRWSFVILQIILVLALTGTFYDNTIYYLV